MIGNEAALVRPTPTPFREFIVKVAQRCNLACDYCYVYTKSDQSWRDRPVVMRPEIWRMAALRIAEHIERHALSEARVVLHGGEPLLFGVRGLVEVVSAIRNAVPSRCRLSFTIQSNGLLLSRGALYVLKEHDIRVGVSLDGLAIDNDRHRRFANGRGSSAAVDAALRLLASDRFRPVFAGLLCTVDLRTDPLACYEHLLSYRPPMIDFLLPHAHWADPPPRPPSRIVDSYADWLVAVFDRWYDAPRQETRLRLLEDIINLILGGGSRSEQVGLSPVAVVTIETDGAIEQVDALKSTYPGAAATGLNVLRDEFDAALQHPGIRARQIGVEALPSICRECPVHRVCGGGHYAHRYRPETSFDNPSVYCTDLRSLIDHVRLRIRSDLHALARRVT